MDLRNFYYKQNVAEDDLDNVEFLIEDAIGKIVEKFIGEGFLNNSAKPTETGAPDWYIHFPANCGYVKESAVIDGLVPAHWATTQDIDCSIDKNSVATIPSAGNKRYIAIFAKFVRNEYDQKIDGHGNPIQYKRDEDVEFEVWSGVEGVSPAKVTIPSESYVLLADVLLNENAGATGLTEPDDWENPGENEIDITRTKVFSVGNLVDLDTTDKNSIVDAINEVRTDAQDAIIRNQFDFNAIIEKIGVNDYKIKDGVRSIKFKYLNGGYLMHGGTSPLSGGDTWGAIKTNNCVSVIFEEGSFLHFGNERGYIEVNTDDCRLQNVSITGTGTVASGILRSFLLNAYKVVYDGCKCFTRLSNSVGNFVGFEGSATAAHNATSKYTNCHIYDYHSSGPGTIYGFKDCDNVSNSSILDLDNSSGDTFGFEGCNRLSNIYVEDLGASISAFGFFNCNFITNSKIKTIDGAGFYGFYDCNFVSGCQIEDGDGTTVSSYGFYGCKQVVGCEAFDLQTTANGINVDGFRSCVQVTGCSARQIDQTGAVSGSVTGFIVCYRISGCIADDIAANAGNAFGFATCKYMAGCYPTSIASVSGTANGFYNCTYGAALYTAEPLNGGNDWMDTVDANITNKVSTPSIWT